MKKTRRTTEQKVCVFRASDAGIATALRMRVLKTHGADHSRLFEIRVY
jgi:hypothetical protein